MSQISSILSFFVLGGGGRSYVHVLKPVVLFVSIFESSSVFSRYESLIYVVVIELKFVYKIIYNIYFRSYLDSTQCY